MDVSKLKCVKDFENYALRTLPQCMIDYYNCGQGDGYTINLNREAFKRFRILPRVLRNVSKRDMSTTVLGEKISIPFGISPTAFQIMAHPDGECGNAKVAETMKTIFILSSYSSTGIKEVAEAAPKAIKWMQLNVFRDRNLTSHIVKKAEEAGYKALVVIVDSPQYGNTKDCGLDQCLKNQMTKAAIFEEYVTTKKIESSAKYFENTLQYLHELLDDSLTWDDIVWLKSITKLPIVLKGILNAEDALLGVKSGASAILVSNHGGRQLDGVPATIEVLRGIVKAIGDQAEVYVDGGITRGTDIFKALALGAKMVFIGKAMIWGLACGGEEGARAVFEILQQELDHAFAITGCSNIKQVTKDMIAHESHFSY